ncbi:TPA: type IV secretion system protein [Salmonella enterica subsp. enterica serovar Bullbay]
MRTEFNQGVNDVVNKILNGADSDIRSWTMAVALFLTAVTAFVYFWRFVENGGALLDLLTLAVMFIFTLTLMATYTTIMDTITGGFNGIANEMQRLALGDTTPDFFTSFVEDVVTKAISAPSVNFTDGMNMIGVALMWEVCTVILEVAIYLADVWINVGTAVAKVTGILFIPLLVSPATRAIFDGWFKFYIGWGLAGIVLKVTSIITMVMIRASVNSAGKFKDGNVLDGVADIITGDNTVKGVLQVTGDNINLLKDISAYSIIAAIMVFSCFIFAFMIGSGVGSTSQGLNNMAVKVAKKAAKALL